MKKIPLTQGMFATVDDCDFEELSKFKWCVTRRRYTSYAIRSVNRGGKIHSILMHRVIISPSTEHHVDHRDGDGLNNTRENLRVATRSDNAFNSKRPKSNTSGFKGAHYDRRIGKWVAHIKVNQKSKYLGVFGTPEEAHAAYRDAAQSFNREFFRAS